MVRQGRRIALLVFVAFAMGPPAAQAQLISTVDYSDTFTLGMNGRANGVCCTPAPYAVEDLHGNAAATWVPQNVYSFNDIPGSFGAGPAVLAAATGNPGAATGVAQSGGGDFSFAYGLRTSYVVEMDAFLSPGDRTDMTSGPSAGGGIFEAGSLSVFFRRDSIAGSPHPAFPATGLPGIGIYNAAVETAVVDGQGGLILTGVNDDNWHRLAVHFNQDADTLKIYVDGVLKADLDLTTFAGGVYQNYSNGAVGAGGAGAFVDGKVLWFDNFQVGAPVTSGVSACFTFATQKGDLEVDFDASCTLAASKSATYSWDFGDGMLGAGVLASHTYLVGDVYTVTLTVDDGPGNVGMTSRTVIVHAPALDYADNFNRADGPVDGWTVFNGTWRIGGEDLDSGPSTNASEEWIWAGSPPLVFPRSMTVTWTQRFDAPGTIPEVGRHGGLAFCTNMPTQRGAGGFSGYFVDWIDRASDRGLRLSRVDSGVFVEIVRGQGAAAPPDVPLHWRLDLDGDRIRLSGDDVLYFDVCDNTYQCGFVGFWTWIAGQQMVVDDFNLDGDALAACFNAAPRSGVSGTPIRFDASCSSVFSGGAGIASYSWDFGDGETTSGLVVDHAFEFADVYTVSLTVEDSLGNRASTSCTVSVAEALVPFADCFDRDPGPIDGEWTVASGNWNITPGGRLEVVTGGEAFIYAGSPPRLLGPEFVAEVDVEFVSGAHPVVGRHGAVHFYWNVPTTDRFAGDSSGYVVFYIDRTGDRGLTLARFDGAALAVLNPPGGTPAFPNPPAQLRIEVDGPTIRVFADGALAIEANDATYRSGLFGLWSWNDNTIRFDNVRVAATSAPVTPPCSLSLTCTVIPPAPGDIGLLQLDGVTSVTDACIAPDGCECIEVETSVDGSPFSRAPSLGLIPLRPDTCPTGTMHEVRARCVNALGQVGPEASCTFTCPEFPPAGGGQVPGDCNQDGDRDISDAVCLFGFLFTGTVPRLPCADGTAAHPANLTLLNHNGDAAIDISDGIALLNFLFSTGAPPASGLGCLRIRDCPERCEP